MISLKNSKIFFPVMILEFIALSAAYWMFFSITINSIFSYITGILFFITLFFFWLNKVHSKDYILISFSEHFTFSSFIFFLFLISMDSLFFQFQTKMAIMYAVIMTIFILYYFLKLYRQKKSNQQIEKRPKYIESIAIITIAFLSLDYIFFNIASGLEETEFKLALILPILFTFIIGTIFTCTNTKFKFILSEKFIVSTVSLIAIYACALYLLLVTHTNFAYFEFILLIHLIMMSASVFFFKLNSENNVKFYLLSDMLFMMFLMVSILLLATNNILLFKLNPLFIIFVRTLNLLFVLYLIVYGYRLIKNINIQDKQDDKQL